MKSKNLKKTPKSPKPKAFSTNPDPSGPAPAPSRTPEPAPPLAGAVSADQPPQDGLGELKRLEQELSQPKPKQGEPQAGEGKGQTQDAQDPKPRRRRFKRPPPENTIRMTIRTYWRFRAWIANRKLQLPPELFGAILEGTDQTMVEPLVEPVVALMDEYLPEQWVEFIEEKSPLLTFLIALFEAEQAFAQRIALIASEVRKERPAADQARPAAPAQEVKYPSKGSV